MASGDYQLSTSGMSSTISEVQSLVSHAGSVAGDLSSMVLNGASFGQFGSSVASANSSLQLQFTQSLQKAIELLTQINQNVNKALGGYTAADDDVSTGYGGNPQAQTAQAAQPDAAAQDGQQNGQQDGQQQGLEHDQTLRDQIGWAEGNEDNLGHVYTDSRGHPTVGHGFNLDRNNARAALEAVGANYADVRAGRADLTTEQAEQLYSNDLATAVTGARGYYDGFDQLDTVRQRVLTDMAFNMGAGDARHGLGAFHRMHDAIARGDYDAAARSMEGSAWFQQVGRRAPPLVEEMRTGVAQPRN